MTSERTKTALKKAGKGKKLGKPDSKRSAKPGAAISAGRITRKPRNAKAKRVMLARDPKVAEDDRGALFMRGTHTNELITEVLKDLVRYCVYMCGCLLKHGTSQAP